MPSGCCAQEHTRVLCHHFISAVQPAAVAACSLNICRVNTNSTKAPFLRANTGKKTVCKRCCTHHSSMQKIELSSRPTVSITEGWRGSRSKPPQFITGPRRLRQMRRFAADGSYVCRESLIIVKCQSEISNQHVRVQLLELQHPGVQVLHVNFL